MLKPPRAHTMADKGSVSKPIGRVGAVDASSGIGRARTEAPYRGAAVENLDTPLRRHAGPQAEARLERSRGTGLGKRISVAEGRERLDGYVTPIPLEDWAGPTAGAGEIKRTLRIARSTLNDWKARGAIVGLLRGQRKLAYPLEQFVDARPVEGLAEIVRLARDGRAAWLWLRQPHGALQGRPPIDVLKAGDRAAVVRTAERDFV